MNKTVKFKTIVENPDYKYTDMNSKPMITVEGMGNLITFVSDGVFIRAVVESFDGRFYPVELKNLKTMEVNKD
jgi:hypothetical protein